MLLRRQSDGTLQGIKICRPFTCNDPEEQQRLKTEFPDDPNIVICKSPEACYVKGSLMPSRALGDFRLKHEEFNFHNRDPRYGYRQPLRDYKGNYITHKPEIREFELTSQDAYLVLASDGLWDVMGINDVSDIVKNNSQTSQEVTQ